MNRESLLKAFIAIAVVFAALRSAGAQPSAPAGPHIYLQTNQVLPVQHLGSDAAVQLLKSGSVEPLSLAQGDFHENGIPDLAVGYAVPGGNLLAIHQGNLDAFAPQSHESWEGIRTGIFPSPFLLQAGLLAVPVRPDFLQAGNFSGQGHVDLLLAARGGSALCILTGNGRGEFKAKLTIPVAGSITALAAGAFGPNSSFPSVLVGVKSPQGYSLLVYAGSAAGLAPVAGFSLAGAATQIALGNLGTNGSSGAAAVVDGEVMLMDWPSPKGEPVLQASGLASSISVQALAVGRFLFDRSPQQQLALLGSDGAIRIAAHAGLDGHPWTAAETQEMLAQRGRPNPFLSSSPSSFLEPWQVMETFSAAVPFSDANHPPILLRARISSRGADDVMAINGEAGQMRVISHPNLKAGATAYGPGEISLMPYTGGRPTAGLAMRVNVDARPGLVMLTAGSIAPLISQPLPDPTFTVNTTTDLVSSNPNACLNNVASQCSLREAVIEANATPGADTIMVPAGTYQLTVPPNGLGNATGGHLDITDGVTIVGTANSDGTPGAIIEAGTSTGNGIDKVFSIAPLNPSTGALGSSFATSMSNLVCQFGLDNDPNNPAGGCFDADAGGAGTGSVALTNVVIQNNSTALTVLNQSDGGGIAFFTEVNASGGVTISQSIVASNVATDAGGGIFVGSFVPLTISNSQVLNNTAVSSGGAQQGGGIALPGNAGTGGDPQSVIHASLISGNKAGSQGGGVFSGTHLTLDTGTIITGNSASGSGAQTGGGLWSNLTNESTQITNATFTGNNAGTSGGAIQVDNSSTGNALNVVFSRIAGNIAPTGNGLNNVAGTVSATDDWWGCTLGPNTSPCDQVHGSNVTVSPWITLSLTASPSNLVNTGSAGSTLTASLLQDSQSNSIALANLSPVLSVPQLPPPAPSGLPVPIPVTWGNAINGLLTNTQGTIQSATGTATATFNETAGGAGQATATVDSGTATANIAIQDFALTLTPSSQAVVLGNSATYTLTASPLGGFTGTINISCSIAPSGLAISSCPSSLTITNPSQPVSASVVVPTSASNTAQNYSVKVLGSSGNLPQHSAAATLNAQNFTVSISPASQTVVLGGSATYTLTVSPINGFTGTVTITNCAISPASAAVTLSGCPTSVTITSGAVNTTLTAATSTSFGSGAAQNYTLSAGGTNAGQTRNASPATLVATAFNVTATSVKTISVGSSAAYTVTVSPVNGFTGTVNLSVSNCPESQNGFVLGCAPNPAGCPSGVSCSLSPSSVTINGGAVSSTFTASASTTGFWGLIFTAKSGTFSNGANSNLNVLASGQPFAILIDFATEIVGALPSPNEVHLEVAALPSFSGVVSISASGLPSGASASQSSVTLPCGSSCTTVVGLSEQPSNVPPRFRTEQSLPITFTGASGSFSSSATRTVIF